MPASAAASAATIDWNVIASAAAVFLTTGVATWFGLKKGRAKVEEKVRVEEKQDGGVAIRAGVLMDNMSMAMLTESLRTASVGVDDLKDAVEDNTRSNVRLWEQQVELKHLLNHVANKLDRERR